MVVELNSSVQLMPTVSTSGVLADEKRRVAVRRFAEARKPPTGDSRRERRPQDRGGEAGHDRAEEADRGDEEERRHLRGRRGRVRAAGGGRDGEQRRRAGERDQAADHAARAEQPRLDRGVGQREGRRHARGAPAGGEDGEQRGHDAAADGRRDRQPAGADGEVRRGDAVVARAPRRARGRGWPRARSPRPSPTRPTIAASQAIMRRIWPGVAGDRAQQGDLALALLDRQAHRARPRRRSR